VTKLERKKATAEMAQFIAAGRLEQNCCAAEQR